MPSGRGRQFAGALFEDKRQFAGAHFESTSHRNTCTPPRDFGTVMVQNNFFSTKELQRYTGSTEEGE
jgi:hypothetical protein